MKARGKPFDPSLGLVVPCRSADWVVQCLSSQLMKCLVCIGVCNRVVMLISENGARSCGPLYSCAGILGS